MVLKEDTPPTIPAGPEIRTHNLPLTSPTCYPLGHDCPYHDFRDILLIIISRGANNCVQRVFDKNIYFIIIFPPILNYFYPMKG